MNVILYQGPLLEHQTLDRLVQNEAGIVADYNVEVNLRTCDTLAELSSVLRELAQKERTALDRYFPFKATDGTYLLQLSQVRYFKGFGHRVKVSLRDGRELTGCVLRQSTSKLMEPLEQTRRFMRTYCATFVNKMYIREISHAGVILDDGETLNISRKYYNAFLRENKKQDMN